MTIRQFWKPPYRIKFDPTATYLLVGCLGGLGKHYSRWMVERGAKSLTYLSRSVTNKENTREFLEHLKGLGIEIVVMAGDVSCLEDVQRTVDSATKPIKGVVQAALTLQVWFRHRLSLSSLPFYTNIVRILLLRL